MMEEEHSKVTIEKYGRNPHFYECLPKNKTITKEIVIAFKQSFSSSRIKRITNKCYFNHYENQYI